MLETLVQPWHWLVAGLLLMAVELFVPSFASLWFGLSAVIVSALAYSTALPFLVLIIIWLGLSVLFCFVWFRWINPKLSTHTKAGLGAGVIVGDVGMIVIAPSKTAQGVVRFTVPKAGATEWVCRSYEPLQAGDKVWVIDIIGNALLVGKKGAL